MPDFGQVEGDWYARCSMCNQKFLASQLVKNWQGMYRCPQHNEPRHPQDYIRAIPDNPTVPFVQDPSPSYRAVCTLAGITSIADYAIADCSVCNTPRLDGLTESISGWIP